MTDFKILSDKDHVLLRPNMYVGSVSNEEHECFVSGVFKKISYVPGLVKIINEIIDNSLDEAIRTNFKFANQISVTIQENEITVQDNGRGIPQDTVVDPDGKKMLRPEAAWTRTKAGSNFNDDRTTVGMNGVGSALTNFLSSRFIGTTSDGNNTVTVSCSNNAGRVFVKTTTGGMNGTKVSFVPDFTRFGVFGISPNDLDIIKDRLESLSVAFPEITFRYNNKKVVSGLKKYAELFNCELTHEETNIALFIGSTDEFKQTSFINGVKTINGGTHVDYFMNRLMDEILPMIKKKHKVEVPRPLFRNGILLGLFIRGFVNPKFDSQTKERLTNSQAETSPYLKDVPYEKLAKKIMAMESIIGPIIEALVAKQLAADARELKAQQNKTRNKPIEGHIRCNKSGGTLFLTEGKSAIGYLLKVRDADTTGGFPLRGKVMNTWGEKPTTVMSNNELASIMSILNLKLGESPTEKDGKWFEVLIDGVPMIVNENDEIEINGKWISCNDL